jgi:hypothetical protein
MIELDKKIQELEDRVDALVRTQIDFQKEISLIRGEIVRLRAQKASAEPERKAPSAYTPTEPRTPPPPVRPAVTPPPTTDTAKPPVTPSPAQPYQRPPVRPQSADAPSYELPRRTAYRSDPVLLSKTTSSDAFSRFVSQYTENARANLEEFVGKNLISLIGIVVLILGVGIGAKYAIDNNWISPLTRIIIGYIFGFGLVGLAIKFKRNYLNFSAVLISGGMAIMYFVTFFAYSSYHLLSQLPAFGLMVMFTGITVAAALIYNRQVIAHIGLVGAYAVPFLLSDDSGNYLALFVYMAVVNTGVLAISLTKNWKPIFYNASLFTWVIFCGWFFTKYTQEVHFYLALTFLGVFFTILYGSKVVQTKLLKDEEDGTENTVASIATSAIFYGMCLAIVLGGSLDVGLSLQFLVYVAVATIGITLASLLISRQILGFYAAALGGWVVFGIWYAIVYTQQAYADLALIFLSVFFLVSYGTSLIQAHLLEPESDTPVLAFSVLTSIVFYGICAALILDPLVEDLRYWTLFTYLAIASILILATSFKFFGRVFVYVTVPLTWAIYAGWFLTRYDSSRDFNLAVIFASVFFAAFYFSILYHRLIEDNFSIVEHASLVLSNAFVFYGFGYVLLDQKESLRDYLGLFTAAHALLHLVVTLSVRALKASAVDVVQVLTVLVLTFASLAVPVQFDGNVVTMTWAIESAVLFWIGRTRGVRLFEQYSYPVMILAAVSLGLEWTIAAQDRIDGTANAVTPFINSDFVTAVVFVAAFGFIYFTNRTSDREPAIGKEMLRPFGIAVAAAASIVLYNMFRMEIGNYFYTASVLTGAPRKISLSGLSADLHRFDIAWQINYTLLFLAAMAAVNLKKLRSVTLASVNVVLGVLTIGVFATVSMIVFHELRTIFMAGTFDPDYIAHWLYVGIRPISYILAAALLYLLYAYSCDPLLEDRVETSALRYGFDAIAYGFVLVVASCELVNLMAQIGIPDATKLGLSILWGIYALMLIGIGIAKKDKKHLRIAAIVLLAVTLVKLFFYDIADLGTIPKTILFVTLGITLLLISFLYNKYKGIIFDTDATQED